MRTDERRETKNRRRMHRPLAWACLALLAGTLSLHGQPTISIDYQGPLAPLSGGPLDPGGIYRTTPAIFPPLPGLVYGSAALGISPAFVGFGELDAFSWGRDAQLRPDSTLTHLVTSYRLMFSTDEFAIGHPGLTTPNNVLNQGATGTQEASADLQLMALLPANGLPPWGPAAPMIGHLSWLDGNAVPPFGGLGIRLIEPNPFTVGAIPDVGDNVDAADFNDRDPMRPRGYFSLDGSFADPVEGINANIQTGQVNGVSAADILVSAGTGIFLVWAHAAQLGLDDADDIDALAIWESGDGMFTPSNVPFDWIGGSGIDMVLFSVRRNSPIIGTLDSILGEPIEEGDILTTPMGGPGNPPGIFIAAEVIGLATQRNALAALGDDLNALSIR